VTEITGGGKLCEEEFRCWYSLQILLRLSIKDDEVSGACTARSVGYKYTRLYGQQSVQERIIKIDLKKLVRMGTWFMWPWIWPHGGLCERRNKGLVSKKCDVLLRYLIECEHLKLVDGLWLFCWLR
jgi:hypothetical protein